jgi:hypothetical protein
MYADWKKRVISNGRKKAARFDIGGAGDCRGFCVAGIGSVAELAKQEPEALYKNLCRKTGVRQDPCVLDTFCAAVAQARDPRLPLEKCKWWYWSGVRKKSGIRY